MRSRVTKLLALLTLLLAVPASRAGDTETDAGRVAASFRRVKEFPYTYSTDPFTDLDFTSYFSGSFTHHSGQVEVAFTGPPANREQDSWVPRLFSINLESVIQLRNKSPEHDEKP